MELSDRVEKARLVNQVVFVSFLIAVLMLVKCIRVGAIRQFALRSVPHQIDNCYSAYFMSVVKPATRVLVVTGDRGEPSMLVRTICEYLGF